MPDLSHLLQRPHHHIFTRLSHYRAYRIPRIGRRGFPHRLRRKKTVTDWYLLVSTFFSLNNSCFLYFFPFTFVVVVLFCFLFCFILLFLSFIITAGFGLSFICLVLLSAGFKYFPPALFIVIYGLLFFFCNLGPGSTVYVLSTEIFPERMSSASLGCVVWPWLAFGLL